MEWRLYQADKKRQKWTIRGTLWNGTIGQFPGHRVKSVAQQIMQNIDALNRARMFGENPPTYLQPWITGLTPKDAARFVKAELLNRRVLDRGKPLAEFLTDFEVHLRASPKLKNGSVTPIRRTAALHRLFEAVRPQATLADISADIISTKAKELIALQGRRKGEKVSQKTRREYLSDAKGYFEWMVDEGRAVINPLRKLKLPSAKGDPVLRRRPMTVESFEKLSQYLIDAPDRYLHQMFDWTSIDRLMVYWTAVMTGFRANELRSLTRAHLDFDSDPARVSVQGWVAKNGDRAAIPLATDFAEAMRDYSDHLHPTAPLLRMPKLALSAMPIEAATRRHYIIALKDFCKWMVTSKHASENPVVNLQPPALNADPSIERIPLTHVQFQKLMAYMDTFERYKQQKARWTAYDRKLVYWTAVMTAYRQNELRTRRVDSLILDTTPARIAIRARHAKNREKGAVAIRAELAEALKAYVQDRDPDEPLFPFPATNHGIVEMFRKDLTGAGITWDFGKDSPDTIDFHTLRSTAITWWIDTPGMSVKKVQVLARLKTPGLVAAYSRNYRLDDYTWLEQGPSLVAPVTPKQAKEGEM